MGSCYSQTDVNPSVVPAKPRKKMSIPKSLKRRVWDHWIGAEHGTALCMCCKYQQIRQIEFHCGHVLAEANGGTLCIKNLRPICAQCNLSMGKKDFHTFADMFK